MNNLTYLNRYRHSLLTKERGCSLPTAAGWSTAGGLAGVAVMDRALAESEEAKPEEEKPSYHPVQGEPPAPDQFIG